ncbi:MAG: YkgJ family cysteine cluster protein [Candidatus Sericytochromatia bacterium]|uniref:YkgJ family cysteine cluster protein n=1 Tax=Candidatus Tanganyikabacteria bacterium TaxID=2961651 RepID=A0A937X5L0_9BACT|nr:YkgJ family cysteine cluster protein [Candidatus Tanganyikabacteria bacterium]
MLDLPVLNNTMRECGFKLPRTDNIGRSGDWQDLYYLTDYLTFVLDRHYESQPCKAGCSSCCRENTVFRVTASEWAIVREYLECADPALVKGILVRTEELYGPYLEQLRQVAKNWQESPDFDAVNLGLDGLPTGCPALEGDNCGIYDARPLVCRAYGYMAAKIRGKESLLICKTYGEGFIAGLREQGFDNIPLPNFEPFANRLTALDGGDEVKPLPLWLYEWGQAGVK